MEIISCRAGVLEFALSNCCDDDGVLERIIRVLGGLVSGRGEWWWVMVVSDGGEW